MKKYVHHSRPDPILPVTYTIEALLKRGATIYLDKAPCRILFCHNGAYIIEHNFQGISLGDNQVGYGKDLQEALEEFLAA